MSAWVTIMRFSYSTAVPKKCFNLAESTLKGKILVPSEIWSYLKGKNVVSAEKWTTLKEKNVLPVRGVDHLSEGAMFIEKLLGNHNGCLTSNNDEISSKCISLLKMK